MQNRQLEAKQADIAERINLMCAFPPSTNGEESARDFMGFDVPKNVMLHNLHMNVGGDGWTGLETKP